MATATDHERLVDGIVSRLNKDLCSIKMIKLHLEQSIREAELSEEERRQQADRWLRWARGQRHLKVISAPVPVGILPNGYEGKLQDVKVYTRGPDDIVFDNNKDIREKVARGNCFLEIHDGQHAGTTCVTYALKKFTGGLGDDDDRDKGDTQTWKKYFLKPLEQATQVVATRKANGEAGHLSARSIDGNYIWCAGSKNVHMLFRTKEDIGRYTDSRFRVASEVSSSVLNLIDTMTDMDKSRLLEFLSLTKYTAIFEILNPSHQHVEDLSYLKQPRLQFITWTSSNLEPTSANQLSCMPPHAAIEIARALGLPTVEYDMLPVTDVEERMSQIRQGYKYEGEVLYFLDKDDAVIGLLKKKTIWYIVCRAIREKIRYAANSNEKNAATFSMSAAAQKIEKRIGEIQTWLGLDDASVAAWKELGTSCLRWCIHNLNRGVLKVCDIADMFPVTWNRFLEDTGRTDKILASWKEPDQSDE